MSGRPRIQTVVFLTTKFVNFNDNIVNIEIFTINCYAENLPYKSLSPYRKKQFKKYKNNEFSNDK